MMKLKKLKFRKFLILFAVILSSQAVYAQKAAVQTAFNYLKYGDLDKAKEAIDGASTNESTMNMSKTWYYRGSIYHAIYESKEEKFASLKPGSLEEARKAYEKTLELDPKNEFGDDVKQRLAVLTSQMLNEGVDSYKAEDYAKALSSFEGAQELNKKYFNKSDTLAVYNSALAADKSDQKDKARKYYLQLIEMNYGGAKIYSMLASSYLADNDTANALMTVNKGRQVYPEDNNLVIQGLNIYLASGRDKEAFEQLDAAIAKDPTNANMYFAKGTVADKLGKNEDAAAAYKKAIELKSDYFDAYYNLGAMYFNDGAELANKANNIPVNKAAEYDAAKKKFEAKFKEAQPYLEKAYELNPKDEATISSLRQLYARIGDLKKSEEMKKALDALKTGNK